MCEELQQIQAGNSPALRVKCESIVFNELPTATRDRFVKQVLPLVRGEYGSKPFHSNDMAYKIECHNKLICHKSNSFIYSIID